MGSAVVVGGGIVGLSVARALQRLDPLDRLLGIGRENGVPVRRLTLDEVAEREPHLRVKGALAVDSTGRVVPACTATGSRRPPDSSPVSAFSRSAASSARSSRSATIW